MLVMSKAQDRSMTKGPKSARTKPLIPHPAQCWGPWPGALTATFPTRRQAHQIRDGDPRGDC